MTFTMSAPSLYTSNDKGGEDGSLGVAGSVFTEQVSMHKTTDCMIH